MGLAERTVASWRCCWPSWTFVEQVSHANPSSTAARVPYLSRDRSTGDASTPRLTRDAGGGWVFPSFAVFLQALYRMRSVFTGLAFSAGLMSWSVTPMNIE